jgi:hypothetical protein
MINELILPEAYVLGQVQGFRVPDGVTDHRLWSPETPLVKNQILYAWGTIIQKLLRNLKDNKNYWIGGMYIEFDNSGAPVNPTPTITRNAGLSYYNSLSSPRDYLRVPIAATEESSSNLTNFPDNNVAHFYAQTAGTVGVHGLTFSDSVNSRVYGGALVAFRDPEDAAQDLVFSRFYFASANQLLKVVGSQIGLLWKPTFG